MRGSTQGRSPNRLGIIGVVAAVAVGIVHMARTALDEPRGASQGPTHTRAQPDAVATVESASVDPSAKPSSVAAASPWTDWYRPVDNPVFTVEHGNNHDSMLFVEPKIEYPYHLIISHTAEAAHLWRAKRFSWSSADWELVSDEYKIGNHYEYDDGVKVHGTYYIYEDGLVYTYSGLLEDASGKWTIAGTFPREQCDDVGVYYEAGVFHLFGEYGEFPHGPDGTSLSHFTSRTGVGDWVLVNEKAVDANPDGGNKYGVGDPTIAKIDGTYYLFCDRESKGVPYRVVAWRSRDLDEPFEYLGEALVPRSNETDDWDNHRIQDADIAYVPELSRYVMTCNMKDIDGNPGGNFPPLPPGHTRVIGMFYSTQTVDGADAEAAPSLASTVGWTRHVIDDSARGADGVRVADVNGDGLLDIAVAWESSGMVRAYLNPGPSRAKRRWPAVTVGTVRSPEDAVFVDLDGDGSMDVVSSTEGDSSTMYVHWAPADAARYLEATAWETRAISVTRHMAGWLYAVPLQVDGKRGVDLVVGAREPNARVGWLESPDDPRNVDDWKYHPLNDAGWIVSLAAHDVDGDGDQDVLVSDRTGPQRGAYWLDNPGPDLAATATWHAHPMGVTGMESMFLSLSTAANDRATVVATAKPNAAVVLETASDVRAPFRAQAHRFASQGFGTVKAAVLGEMLADDGLELVISCEDANDDASGVLMLSDLASDDGPTVTNIAGPRGTKYDRIELLDLDGDGDLDVLTTEERDGLGVIWFENPQRDTKGLPSRAGPPKR